MTSSSATITCFFSEVIFTSNCLATYFSSDLSSSYSYSSPASLGYSYSSEVVGREETEWNEEKEEMRRRVRVRRRIKKARAQETLVFLSPLVSISMRWFLQQRETSSISGCWFVHQQR